MSDVMQPVTGRFEGVVQVEALPPQGMLTLRGDLAEETLRTAVRDCVGVEVPLVRRADFSGSRGALWMSPDELMLVVPQAEAANGAARMAEALAGIHALAVDVSDARATFMLSGAGLREVIAKLAPVDMSVDGFGPGDFRRTRFGQLAAAFWMVSETEIRIVCFRSVAHYMYEMLCHAADEAGAMSVYAQA